MFITLEGIEGSGKSLQLLKLKQEFENRGLDCVSTREPGGTAFGRELRSVLLDARGAGREPLAELLLYLADRYQHLQEVIEPSLSQGRYVLCDRYHDATMVYQGHARGLGFDLIEALAGPLKIRQPDLTLVLDLDVDTGLQRAINRNQIEKRERLGRFEAEGRNFHLKVQEGYRLLAERYPDRIRLIDASGSPKEVFQRILRILDQHLKPCSEKGIRP